MEVPAYEIRDVLEKLKDVLAPKEIVFWYSIFHLSNQYITSKHFIDDFGSTFDMTRNHYDDMAKIFEKSGIEVKHLKKVDRI